MKDKDIIEFIKKLDSETSKECVEAELRAFGEVALYANKEGYLRMGLELIKCAFDETAQEADLNYLFTEKSEFGIEHLTRTKEELDIISS